MTMLEQCSLPEKSGRAGRRLREKWADVVHRNNIRLD